MATEKDPPVLGAGAASAAAVGKHHRGSQPHEDRLRRQLPKLVGAVMSMTGCNREDAEDAVHDAFVAAMERGQRFDSIEGEFRWTREVAKNRIIRGRQARSGVAPEPWEAVRDVAEVVLLQEECNATRADVLALPAAQRQVLAMRVVDQLPPREIARRLDTDVKIVKSRIAEARRTLRVRRVERGYAVLIPVAAWRAIRRASRAGGPVAVSAVGVMTWIAATTTPVAIPFDAHTDWADSASQQPERSLRASFPVADGGGAGAARHGRPAPPTDSDQRVHSAAPRLAGVAAAGRACVSGTACAGTDATLPTSHQDIAYIRIPSVAGEPERYVYVQAPDVVTSNVAPWACDAVPDTALTGCQPGAGSPSSPTVPEGKA